jgi:hypothetical protein
MLNSNIKAGIIVARRAESALTALHRRLATGFSTGADRRRIFSPDSLRGESYEPLDVLREQLSPATPGPPWWGSHRFDLLERQRHFIQFGSHQLRPLLRVETPFHSPPVFELATSLPLRFLLGQRAYVRMQARYFSARAGVRDTRRRLPPSARFSLRLRKQALDTARRLVAPARARRQARQSLPADYATWSKNELRERLADQLSRAAPASRGVLQAGAAEQLLREHLDGARDHPGRLGCLLTFDAWLRSLRSG